MDASTYAATLAKDAAIAVTAFTATHVMYKGTKSFFSSRMSTWSDIKPSVQNRMACEIALLPCRLVMGICCLPIVIDSFKPANTWTPSDTSRAIIACATMAGSYCYDLTIERADILSLIHHCFGPGMLLWIEMCYSTYTPYDAVMVRLLVSFIYFGAAMGGTLTTTILVLLKVLRPHIAPKMLHTSISSLVWVLSINTLCATSFGSLYMGLWEEDLFAHWGYWCLVPMVLSAFEYYLQWRWAVKFQLIADKLAITTGLQEKKEKSETVWEMMQNKYMYMKVIIGCWLASYLSLYGLIAREALRREFKLLI